MRPEKQLPVVFSLRVIDRLSSKHELPLTGHLTAGFLLGETVPTLILGVTLGSSGKKLFLHLAIYLSQFSVIKGRVQGVMSPQENKCIQRNK